LWDRLLGTYRAQPAQGHEGMAIGVAQFRSPARYASFFAALTLPFRGDRKSPPTFQPPAAGSAYSRQQEASWERRSSF
jgi:hypothetical protein